MKMNVETLEAHTFFTTTFFFFSGPCLGERNLKMHLSLVVAFSFSQIQKEKETHPKHTSQLDLQLQRDSTTTCFCKLGWPFFVQNCEFLMKHYCQETIISLTKKLQIMAKWEF